MKRTGSHPQGVKRPTCLADIVHQQSGWEIRPEIVRRLLKTHHDGVRIPSMTLKESLAFDEFILANPNYIMDDLIEKFAELKSSNS
jgi:hypothetical protein